MFWELRTEHGGKKEMVQKTVQCLTAGERARVGLCSSSVIDPTVVGAASQILHLPLCWLAGRVICFLDFLLHIT